MNASLAVTKGKPEKISLELVRIHHLCDTGASLHDRRFMSQAGRTRYFARSARRGGERLKYRVRPALAHKAPVMQAIPVQPESLTSVFAA